ncbi:MAG: LysR family transcriptional regulator [Gammaproteobacteria bacterium]|nr:LysR family transcriptional regulator [Gammaproteobacteria bacterium]
MLKPLPPLKTLPTFITVAHYLSFSQAARTLHVTHSAISQSIKLLETYLGHPLFIRQGAKIALTDTGERYYSEIRSAMAIIQQSTQQQLARHYERPITINVMTTLAMRWIIPQLGNFQALHPTIDLRIATLGRQVDFIANDIDLSIEYGHADQWPNLQVEKLFDDALVLVASPQLINASTSAAEIIKQHHRPIQVTDALRQHDWRDWCRHMALPLPKKKTFLGFQTSLQALQATISGLGVMVTHKPFILDDISNNQLTLVANSEIVNDKSYFIVTSPTAEQKTELTTFCQWLTAEATRLKAKW